MSSLQFSSPPSSKCWAMYESIEKRKGKRPQERECYISILSEFMHRCSAAPQFWAHFTLKSSRGECIRAFHRIAMYLNSRSREEYRNAMQCNSGRILRYKDQGESVSGRRLQSIWDILFGLAQSMQFELVGFKGNELSIKCILLAL